MKELEKLQNFLERKKWEEEGVRLSKGVRMDHVVGSECIQCDDSLGESFVLLAAHGRVTLTLTIVTIVT